MNTLSLSFDPLLPDWLLAVFALPLILFGLYGLYRRACGAFLRLSFLILLIFALTGPHLVREDRRPLSDVVVALVDRTASNRLADRALQSDDALARLRAFAMANDVELRVVDISGDADRSDLLGPLYNAMSDVPQDRLAAGLLITDGRIDDDEQAAVLDAFERPIHSLLTGSRTAPDRRIETIRAPEYGIVERPVTLTLKVVQDNMDETGPVSVTIRRSDADSELRSVRPGEAFDITVTPVRRGKLLLDVAVEPVAGEASLVNNRTLYSINAVRDRLRVLLVSGEPHPGERVWRDTLKSDPAVDLIHFTILRLPTSQDPTPVSQLSLIPFPTERLFAEQLHDFDLVIFDRYSLRGVLDLRYFDNLLEYVKAGGAIFAANGPEYAENISIFRTPLAQVLQTRPTGSVSQGGFVPVLTDIGKRHPVTAGLDANGTGSWGRWFRMVDNSTKGGDVLMRGPSQQPLLVLSRAGDGRIAELMSDHIWLWARNVDGGGPNQELLRRTVHWLMKEPDLEERALSARQDGNEIVIERRSLAPVDETVDVTLPDGSTRSVTLTQQEDGTAWARIPADQFGLYRLSDGEDTTVAGVGPIGGHELSRILPSDEIVGPLADTTGGGVFWLEDGMPTLRRPSANASASGNDWLGFPRRSASRIENVAQSPLLPAWAWVLILGGLLALVWFRESK